VFLPEWRLGMLGNSHCNTGRFGAQADPRRGQTA
jgi:hypothetical protein